MDDNVTEFFCILADFLSRVLSIICFLLINVYIVYINIFPLILVRVLQRNTTNRRHSYISKIAIDDIDIDINIERFAIMEAEKFYIVLKRSSASKLKTQESCGLPVQVYRPENQES